MAFSSLVSNFVYKKARIYRLCLVTGFPIIFFVSKNNFLFLKLKNFFGNPKWTKNKNFSQNSICE